MPVDFAMDTNTGDWIFSAHTDLQFAVGEYLVVQRMITRLRVPVGSWLYDDDGTFGSGIYKSMGAQINRMAAELPVLIEEALAPMLDIEILGVDVGQQVENPTQLVAIINYRYRVRPEEVELVGETLETFTAAVPL